jgi:leucyl aminopeptidase (aminopeptidase T)
MRGVDVLVALTTHSLSHTDAREAATKAGVRTASMPGFSEEMFYPEGPMTADYDGIAAEATQLASLMSDIRLVEVTSAGGTDMRFSLEGRRARADTGLYREKGKWGNLPAGEAYVAPVEGSAEGGVVVEVGWYPGLESKMIMDFEEGVVVRVDGGGKVGDCFRDLLRLGNDTEPYVLRRNLAELGVGVNPKASRTDNVLEAEKIRGTVHLAIGSNIHFGGRVKADFHTDFVIPRASLILDGSEVMRDGRLDL